MSDGNFASRSRQEHIEAVRLSSKSRHIPIGTILMGGLMLASVLPTVLTILAQSPVNPIP